MLLIKLVLVLVVGIILGRLSKNNNRPDDDTNARMNNW